MSRITTGFHASLSDKIIENLAARNLLSPVNFILHNSDSIAKYSGLNFREVVKIKDEIISKYASNIQTGQSIFEQICCEDSIISTGIIALDQLLDGGFATGNIYELCGPYSTGKSQIMMAACGWVCSRSEQTALYIDTKGDFDVFRIQTLLGGYSEHVAQVLERINVVIVRTPNQLFNTLNSYGTNGFRLIVLDSLPAIYYQFLGKGESCEGVSFLNNLSSILQYLAQEKKLIVLVSNYTMNWSSGERTKNKKAALGKFWSHIPSTRLATIRVDALEIKLTVVKSATLPLGSSAIVKIDHNGIK